MILSKLKKSKPELASWNEVLPFLETRNENGKFKLRNISYTSEGLQFSFTKEEYESQLKLWTKWEWPIEFLKTNHFGKPNRSQKKRIQ